MFFEKGGVVPKDVDIERLERDIEQLRKRVLVLECQHEPKNLKIEETYPFLHPHAFDFYIGRKFCQNCGKTLEYYNDNDELLKASNKLMRELIALNEKEMKGK